MNIFTQEFLTGFARVWCFVIATRWPAHARENDSKVIERFGWNYFCQMIPEATIQYRETKTCNVRDHRIVQVLLYS